MPKPRSVARNSRPASSSQADSNCAASPVWLLMPGALALPAFSRHTQGAASSST